MGDPKAVSPWLPNSPIEPPGIRAELHTAAQDSHVRIQWPPQALTPVMTVSRKHELTVKTAAALVKGSAWRQHVSYKLQVLRTSNMQWSEYPLPPRKGGMEGEGSSGQTLQRHIQHLELGTPSPGLQRTWCRSPRGQRNSTQMSETPQT